MANAAHTHPGMTGSSDGRGLEKRKHDLAMQRLELCLDTIKLIDSNEKDGWSRIILELLEGGFTPAELETELAASANTIYKWRSGMAAPREMTRRLLHRAILEMVEDRLGLEKARA